MDCQLLVTIVACVAVAASSSTLPSTTDHPQQPATSPGQEQSQETPNTTASSTAPLHDPTNLDPDSFFEWLNEVDKAEAKNEDKGATPQPIVQANNAGDSTTTASTSVDSTSKPTEQTKSNLENGPEVSPTIISEVDLFYSELSEMKLRTTESDGELQTKTTATEKSTTTERTMLEHNTEEPSTVNSNTEDDIEWLEKMIQDSTKSPDLHSKQPESSQNNIPVDHVTASPPTAPAASKGSKTNGKDGNKFKITSPDKFYGWLSNLPPKSKPEALKKDKSESMTKVSTEEFFTSTIIIVSVSVVCGILGIFAIIITSYIIIKRRGAIKSVDNPRMNIDKGGLKSGYTDVFHGIPTNNDIWKNLEMLSVNAPAVLPDNHPKV